MSDESELTDPCDPAAEAFEALRQEVERLGRAVTGIAAELAPLERPDYTETLGRMLHATQTTSELLKALAEMPALRLSPTGWSREIAAAGEEARRKDRAALESARESFQQVANALGASLVSARTAVDQRRWVIWSNLTSLLAGLFLWIICMGTLLRAAPASWLWPEHLVAHVMDMNEEEAGAHLIATAAPDHWRDIVLGYWIVTKNREAITECERRFETSQKPIPCTVLIRNPPSE